MEVRLKDAFLGLLLIVPGLLGGAESLGAGVEAGVDAAEERLLP